MSQLMVRVSESQRLMLDDLSETMGMKKSELLRVFVFDGINRIKAQAARDLDKAKETAALMEARSKL